LAAAAGEPLLLLLLSLLLPLLHSLNQAAGYGLRGGALPETSTRL